MKITTVLFDLDGTLLPMDTDAFLGCYFRLLTQKLATHGYDPAALTKAIWASTAAMVKNDGSCTNEAAFWRSHTGIFGEDTRNDLPVFEDFYREHFPLVRKSCGYTPLAKQTILRCKEKGLRVALATNPVFPAMATHQRIRWAGLEPEDFELVTTYENSSSCKPNLLYYQQVMAALGVQPEECLMVGNDVSEDMVARQLGLQVFLLTPCLLNKHQEDIDTYPHGDFEQLLAFLDNL